MVAVMFAGVVALNATPVAAENCSITTTLKLGSKGADVKCLQTALGLSADGSFGPKTKAAVVSFQKNAGLTADGVFGAKSRAQWMANNGVAAVSYVPPGCTSATGFSPVTGGACTAVYPSTLPAGCTSTAGFSATTGASCATGVVNTGTFPAGCTSASGFSPVSGASCATGVVTQQTGPLSVSLASNNPASGYIIANQATADLLHVTFSGNGTVNTVVLQRTGISDQNTLANVYLYDGATRLTDGFSFNNVGQLTMNGLGIVVNGSRTISVKADVNTATASSLGITLSSYTVAGGTPTSVSIAGNQMTYGQGSLSTAYLGTNTASTPSTVNAGTSAYTVWSAPLQVNTRAIWLKGANFRMTGSAPAGALANIKLYVDGVAVGNVATMGTITGSNYAMFDFSSTPVSLSTGSHTVDVRADVVTGSSYKVTVSLQQAADLVLYDGQVGVNLAALGVAGSAFTSNNAGEITINAGSASVVIDPTFQSMTNITGGSTNAVIGKFKVHGYGEDVKVSSLSVTPNFAIAGTTATSTTSTVTTGGVVTPVVTTGGAGYIAAPVVTVTQGTAICSVVPTATATISGGVVTALNFTTGTCTVAGTLAVTIAAPVAAGLNNVTLYFNGSQVGSSVNWTSGPISFNLGSQMILPAGTDSFIEVHADLQTTGSVNYTTGQVSVTLNSTPINNAQGQTSHTSVTFPGSPVSNSALTIQTGLLAVAKNANYQAQNANPNTAGVKIGSFTLQNQSTSESVRVTSLVVSLFDVSGTTALSGLTTPALTNFSNLRTSETSGSGSTPVQPSASNTFSVDFTLAAGVTKTIDILADTSSATSGSVIAKLALTALGSSSNVSIAQNGNGLAVQGQTIGLAIGTLATPSLLTVTSTAAQYVPAGNGGASNSTQATYNFVSSNGASTITELKFIVTGPTTGASVSVNGVTAPFVGGVAYLTGLNLAVPNGGGGLTQNVFVSYPEVGTSGLTPGTTSAIALSYYRYTSGGTTTTKVAPTDFTAVAAPTMILVGSRPTVTISATPSTGLALSGVGKIGEVTVAADAKGNIKLNTIVFTVSSSGFGTAPTAVAGTVISTNNSSSNPVAGAVCTPAGLVVTCTLDTNANPATGFDGLTVTAGTSVTLSLFGSLTGGVVTTGVPVVSSSIAASTFNWDDTSTNGAAGSINLSGTPIYQFPNNSFSIRQ